MCIHSLLSLMPEKEAKRAFRNRNPCDASRPHAEENGSHTPSAQANRFLNARIASIAHCRRFRACQLSIYRVTSKSSGECGGRDSIEGFQFRCTPSMYGILPHLTHRNCWHVWLGLNPCVTISTDFFGYFLSRKESDNICWDSMGLPPRGFLYRGK
jgi:hypothetical protein